MKVERYLRKVRKCPVVSVERHDGKTVEAYHLGRFGGKDRYVTKQALLEDKVVGRLAAWSGVFGMHGDITKPC